MAEMDIIIVWLCGIVVGIAVGLELKPLFMERERHGEDRQETDQDYRR